jgi:Protein of unknown function (DUF3300)
MQRNFALEPKLSKPQMAQRLLASVLTLSLWLPLYPPCLAAQNQQAAQDASGPPYTQQTSDQLQPLVAPIALYPDSLVAQILAASTFPEQLVDADRWVQTHPDLKGEALAQAVDPQPWDPSIKALTTFPAVLGNMDKNLSWTSALGDAYYNQEQDVMDAIQVMRRRAQQAGILNSTSQQIVTTEGSDIQIEPVSPEIVYVPAYDPWIVYGGPIVAWPGWYPYPGVWYDGPAVFFGAGFGIGFFGHYGWLDQKVLVSVRVRLWRSSHPYFGVALVNHLATSISAAPKTDWDSIVEETLHPRRSLNCRI